MKKICVFVILISSFAFASASAPPIGQATVYVENASDVQGNKIQVQGPSARVISGQGAIYANDSIQTAAGQTVKLVFGDQTEVWVSPHSRLIVQNYSLVPQKKMGLFFLDQGLVRSLVTKDDQDKIKFQIRTRAVTLGVRGTEFIAEEGVDRKTTLYTLDGAVAMGSTPQDLDKAENHRVVEAGMSSEIKNGQRLPEIPKKFDHNALMGRLNKISSHMSKSIKEKMEFRKAHLVNKKFEKVKSINPVQKFRRRKIGR